MYGKTDIMNRLDELNRASPIEAADLFAPLKEALESYFTADGAFTHDAQYTIHQLTGDIMTRATVYENQEKMPSPPTNAPTGYENVGDLFNGGGAFPEIMTIRTETFVEAFVEEAAEGGDGEEGGEGTLKNPYLETWAEQMSGARSSELSGLASICQFCDSGGYSAGLAMLFEDLGGVVKSMSTKELAQRIYIDGGWYTLINEFRLPIHIPTMIQNGVIP